MDNNEPEKPQEPEKPGQSIIMLMRGVPLVVVTLLLVVLMIERDNLITPKPSSNFTEVESIGFGADLPTAPIKTIKPEPVKTAGTTPVTTQDTPASTASATSPEPVKPATPQTTTQATTQTPASATGQTTTQPAQPTQPTQPATTPQKVDWSKTKITGPIPGAYIAIFVSKRIVALIKDNQYVRVYYYAKTPAVASAPKTARNDRKAPIGDYYITKHDLQGKVMTLILSYPSPADAAKALARGSITQQQKTAIEQAYSTRSAPPPTTALGGPVRIRGAGSANTADKFSTGSNISIAPAQMEELWLATRKGTAVRIVQ